jgi:hypothetical protein
MNMLSRVAAALKLQFAISPAYAERVVNVCNVVGLCRSCQPCNLIGTLPQTCYSCTAGHNLGLSKIAAACVC